MPVPKKAPNKRTPSICVILPVHNSARTLHETLVYLFGGINRLGARVPGLKYPGPRMEVLVADHQSTDQTVEITKKWRKAQRNLKLIQKKDSQDVLNAALKSAKGEYVLLIGEGCAPAPNWATQLLEPFQKDPRIGLVGGAVKTLPFDPQNQLENYLAQSDGVREEHPRGKSGMDASTPARFRYPREVDGGPSCKFFSAMNAAISREALLSVGNRFGEGDDAGDRELSIRVFEKGFNLHFQPSAVVSRVAPADLGGFCGWMEEIGYEHPRAIRNHAKRVLEVRFQYVGDFSLPPIPFPVQAMVYWGDFHMIHLFGILAILRTLVFKYGPATNNPALALHHVIGLWLFFGFFLVKYFSDCLAIQPSGDFLYWCWVRYRSNLALFWGGIKGSFKFGRPYIGRSW